MALDIVALIIVISLLAWGARRGALAQILQVAAVVLSIVAARPAGAVMSVLIYGETTAGAPFVDFGLMALGGSVIFGIASVVGHFILRGVRDKDEDPSTLDRLGGAALGGLKGLLLAWLAAAAVLSIEGALETADPDDALSLRGSQIVSLARGLPQPWEFAPGRLKKATGG